MSIGKSKNDQVEAGNPQLSNLNDLKAAENEEKAKKTNGGIFKKSLTSITTV